MASINPENNCITCLYRHTSSYDPRCIRCLDTSKSGNQFPEWEPTTAPAKN